MESELETVSADKKEGSRRNSRRNAGLARQTRTRNSRKSLTPVLARLSPTIQALLITHSTLIDAEEENNAPPNVPQSPRPMSPRDSVGSPMNTSSMNENKDTYLDSESSNFRQLGAFLYCCRVPVSCGKHRSSWRSSILTPLSSMTSKRTSEVSSRNVGRKLMSPLCAPTCDATTST